MDWQRFKREGLHYLNSLLSEEQWKAIYLLLIYTFMLVACVATIMAFTSQGGFLYSAMRLPIWQNLMVLSEDASLPARAHPEQGIHWTTVILYSIAIVYVLLTVRRRNYTRLHALVFTICISVGMWLFPFEWVYVPLLDIFHNYPVEHQFSTLLYGLWRNPLSMIANSVIGRNGFMACGILFAHVITVDNYHLSNYWHSFRWIYHFNWKSLLLALSWIGMFVLWVCLPLITPIQTDRGLLKAYNYTQEYPYWLGNISDVTQQLDEFGINYTVIYPFNNFTYKYEEPVKGTPYFPQTIYVWYGKHPENPYDPYDIIHEEWHPNNLVRSINIVTKVLTVVWMVYTFTPKSKEEFLR